MPTCMIEDHWKKYDPRCMMCREELKEAVKQKLLPKEEYNSWILGTKEIGIPDKQRGFIN